MAPGQPSNLVSWAVWLILKHGGLCPCNLHPSGQPPGVRHLALHLCGMCSPTFPFCQGPPFWSIAQAHVARKPQLEASLTDLSLSGALARPAGRLAQPTTFALPPAGSGIAPGAEAARWRLPGRAQAAITWERKHLTLEAATQYHLLCGGGRGRRLAINSLLRANSSPVLWNQTVLPPRGGRLHSVHSQRTAARLLSS